MDGQNINNNYQQPTPQEPKKTDTLAIVSLILGIAAIVMGCCIPILGIALGVGGIVCSVMSKNKAGKSGLATGGMVCSIIGIVFAVIWWIAGAIILGVLGLAS